MKTVRLPCGENVSALGLGTWHIGDSSARRAEEIAAVQLALDLGAKLIDTAEMYGEGRSEQLVGEAIAGRRDEAFLVSKVLPQNAQPARAVAACEPQSASPPHGPARPLFAPLARQRAVGRDIGGATALQRAGKIRHFGVSNLDLADMRELSSVAGGPAGRHRSSLFTTSRVAASSGTCCLGCVRVGNPDHGLFADRTGAAGWRTRTSCFAQRQWHDTGAGRPCLAVVERRRDRNPKNKQPLSGYARTWMR